MVENALQTPKKEKTHGHKKGERHNHVIARINLDFDAAIQCALAASVHGKWIATGRAFAMKGGVKAFTMAASWLRAVTKRGRRMGRLGGVGKILGRFF